MIVHLRLPQSMESTVTWMSRALMGAGLTLFGIYLFTVCDSWIYQQVQTARFETAGPAIHPEPSLQPVVTATLKWFEADPLVLAELNVPRLGFQAMVREGTDASTLRKSVGHVVGTSLPGTPGNAVLAGHRDTFFRPLRHIRKGDMIRVRLHQGEMKYRVDSLAIVEPDAVEVMRPSSESRITLITCYPFDYIGPAPHRYVIGAHQITDP